MPFSLEADDLDQKYEENSDIIVRTSELKLLSINGLIHFLGITRANRLTWYIPRGDGLLVEIAHIRHAKRMYIRFL
jgi:hypothetical protein